LPAVTKIHYGFGKVGDKTDIFFAPPPQKKNKKNPCADVSINYFIFSRGFVSVRPGPAEKLPGLRGFREFLTISGFLESPPIYNVYAYIYYKYAG
jgi:hypothetical protein